MQGRFGFPIGQDPEHLMRSRREFAERQRLSTKALFALPPTHRHFHRNFSGTVADY
jgi:hypothetical protein